MKRKWVLLCAITLGVSLFGCEKIDNNGLEYVSESSVIAVDAPLETTQEPTEENITQTEITTTELTVEETETTTEASSSEEDVEQFKNNLAIVGDSIAYGYAAYEKMPMNNVFAKQGITTYGVKSATFPSDYGEAYALDIIALMQPKYLMLSMGMNEIGNKQYEDFAERYKELAEDFHDVSPDTIIYVAAITPVCGDAETEYIDNENIVEHNKVLEKSFDGENNIYYVNLGKILKNEDNQLDSEYSGGDGIHLTGEAYDMLLNKLADIALNN